MTTPPPLPDGVARWALFLDFDGTLAEFAAHPDQVQVSPELGPLIERLAELLDGALALVSGRRIESIDRMLHPLRATAAGLHGLERRNGGEPTPAAGDHAVAEARRTLQAFVAARPGLLLEDKGGALALHYRNAPALEEACREQTAALAARLPGHHVLAGKMVFELKPLAANKGRAIRAFLQEAPFAGRVPVFAGDDRTDEDGFAWVNDSGGVSIKVGGGDTAARYRVADVDELHDWLRRLALHLEGDLAT